MSPAKRYAKKQAKARRRRYRTAQERRARDRRQAQHAVEALQQALDALGLPEDLVSEIAGRLRSQRQLLGKIVGMMCPSLFGCRTNTELCRVRGWDKNLPTRLLGALPKRSWLKRLRRLGLEVLLPLWRHAASASEATLLNRPVGGYGYVLGRRGRLASAVVLPGTTEPQYVFGAATHWPRPYPETQSGHVTDCRLHRHWNAEKSTKFALRTRVSLDKRVPHTCSAQGLAPAQGRAPVTGQEPHSLRTLTRFYLDCSTPLSRSGTIIP